MQGKNNYIYNKRTDEGQTASPCRFDKSVKKHTDLSCS